MFKINKLDTLLIFWKRILAKNNRKLIIQPKKVLIPIKGGSLVLVLPETAIILIIVIHHLNIQRILLIKDSLLKETHLQYKRIQVKLVVKITVVVRKTVII